MIDKADIDVRDFESVPKNEQRERICSILMLITVRLGYALTDAEKADLERVTAGIKGSQQN